MARFLVVGGSSCRALSLTRSLVADGHAVRAVTRSEAKRATIEQAGAECWIGDPDVVGTLRYALEGVTVLLWLLGTADDADLHGSRLAMMLEKTIDTTARGVVYEAGAEGIASGVATVERIAGYNEIPYRIVGVGGDYRAAIGELLAR
ncbi:MAG TPA: NAD(P)H-binding protein [Solirubrobacteraceae bacterium]|nr:NAD(P)H-binding protein [Solirubrobacteraceae bacterium]